MNTMKLCPAPMFKAFFSASFLRSGSFPSLLILHAPLASQNAIPNLAFGTEFTIAS